MADFTFTGPEQVSSSSHIGTGSFYWQNPTVFLNGSTPAAERICMVLSTVGANWRIRAFLRDNVAGTWSELDAGNGPTVAQLNGGLQTPFGCPTFIEDPNDATQILCAYPRLSDSTIAVTVFSKTAKTFGATITGGPVVHGVDLVFIGSVSADDTGAKVCVSARALDNSLLFVYQGPPEVVGAHNCLRPYFVVYDRTGAAWGVASIFAVAGEDDPYCAHGIVVDPNTHKAYGTFIRPTNGQASPNNTEYRLFMAEIATDNTVSPKVLMTANVTQTREPLISYPILRPAGSTFELMCAFVKNNTLATIKAAVVRGIVGTAPTFSETDVSTTRDNAPGDGSFLATVGIGYDSQKKPYLFWSGDLSTTVFFYQLWYSKGGDAGAAWSDPVSLFISGEDDGTDFLENGISVSILNGIGSIGFGLIAQVSFLSTGGGATLVDGVAYFEFIPNNCEVGIMSGCGIKIKDWSGKYYMNDYVPAELIFGFDNSQAPGFPYPEIYIPKDQALYLDVAPFLNSPVNGLLTLCFKGMKVYGD